MQLSLVIPLFKDFDAALRAEKDLLSIFAKFPIEGELVWVVDPPVRGEIAESWQTESEGLLSEHHPEFVSTFRRRVILQKRRMGRGAAIQKGLDEARGEIIALLSADLSVPVSEVITALRVLWNDPQEEVGLVLGERSSRKLQGQDLRSPRKRNFDEIEHQKAISLYSAQIPDPTSPFIVIRKKTWEQIKPGLKLRSWYYTPEILRRVLNSPQKVHSFAINHQRGKNSHQRWWESLFG